MKRNIFTLLMVFVLALGTTALMAQTTGTPQTPPSQQVDQSGQPETGPGPDVDVDTGANAEGAVDVDVNRTTDPDTAADGDTDTATGTYDSDQSLPDTASDMPLLGLLGLLSLAGACVLRFNR